MSPAAKPPKTQFSCNARGATSAKGLGKCPGCGALNTLKDTVAEPSGAARHRCQSLAPRVPVVAVVAG